MAVNICGKCELPFDRRKPIAISCAGFCENSFHSICVDISSDVLKHIKTPGLYWYCEECNKIKNSVGGTIKNEVEFKLNNVLKEIEQLFINAKNEVIKLANAKLSDIQSSIHKNDSYPLYSQVASNKPMVIIKPKDSEKTNAQTKLDIMGSLNPVDLNLQVSRIKNVSEGGILIGCNDNEGAKKFKQQAVEKLSANYEIKDVKTINPKLRIVGMIEGYSDDKLLEFVKTQNDVFGEASMCNVLKIWPTKKNRNIYQALLEVDAATYGKVLNLGHLFINYDVCAVYDGLQLKLCYKCSGLNHFQKSCTNNKVACPKCSLDHYIKDCPSNAQPKCVNCYNAKIADNSHFAWDASKCTVYKKKLEHYKASFVLTQ